MKRNILAQLLGTIENKDDILEQIMKMNGEDIENAKSNATKELNEEIGKYKTEIETYKKNAETQETDKTELERLKKFETDTLAEKKKTKLSTAFKAMLDENKVKSSIATREMKTVDYDKIELDKDGNISDGWKKTYMESFKKDFGDDGFDRAPIGTGIPSAQGYSGKQKAINEYDSTDWANAIAERNQN